MPDRDIRVRPATPADLDTVVPLLMEQMRDHHIPVSAAHVRTTVAATVTDPKRGLVLVGLLGGRIVGVAYVSFAHPLEHAGEIAWIEELFVEPTARGAGLGRLLLQDVAARAEARGCAALDLEVDADHQRATHLYARTGFRSMQRTHWTRPLSAWDW